MANTPGVRFTSMQTVISHPTGDVSHECDTAGKKHTFLVGGTLVAQIDANGLRLPHAGVMTANLTLTNITTAGAETYTAAQIKTGLITRDPNGAGRTDLVDTAANILAGITALAKDGDTHVCYLINTADAAETITLGGAPAGITYANAGQTITQNESAILLFRRTSSSAVTVYILGA